MDCVFCAIRDGRESASRVYEDDRVLAFMDIRPVRRGTLLVVPKQHIDHFIDLPDDLASAVLMTGQRLARSLRCVLRPKRVGMVVHGFGVAHAHVIVIPLEHPWDITAAQFAEIADGRVIFRWENVQVAARAELDALAATLASTLATAEPVSGRGA